MDLGTPCSRTTSRKINPAMCIASEVFLQGIKCAIFEYRSTTTKTESTPRCVRGNPKAKSIERSSQMPCGIGSGVYKPVFCDLPFDVWHMQQRCRNLSTSHHMCGQKNLSSTATKV